MSQFFAIHPTHPETRLIKRAVDIVRAGGVIAYPTDSCYAIGCHIGDKQAMERIRRIRGVDERHHFTLVCRDLSEIGTFAKVDNAQYRLLKAHTPAEILGAEQLLRADDLRAPSGGALYQGQGLF